MTVRFFKPLCIASAVSAAFMATAPAHAVDAKISGHVARAIMYADDGENSDVGFVDQENSSTRLRAVGTGDLGGGITAGVKLEWEFVSNNSASVAFNADGDLDQGAGNVSGDFSVNERHFDAFFQGGFGKVSLGQGDGAANGAAEVDLSGTSIINYAGSGDNGGSLRFQQDGAFGPTIGSTTSQQDFESRFDRVRYDTPALGPVKVGIAYGKKSGRDVTDLAVRGTHDLGAGGKLAWALAYSVEDRDDDEETTGGSVSYLHGSGFNATVAYTNKDDGSDDDGTFSYVKLGYKSGMHAVSLDYGRAEDQAASGDEADFIGVGYVYKPKKWAEIFVGYKVHTLDRDGADFDDITVGSLGTRLKF